MNLKRTVFTVLVSFASAFGAIAVYNHFGLNKQQVSFVEPATPAKFTAFNSPKTEMQPIDFRYAAAASTPCVVHIKSSYKQHKTAYHGNSNDPMNELFQYFHGPNPYESQPAMATALGCNCVARRLYRNQ